MPTIFYSWQSDLPNAINRNLVRRALEDAVESLNRAEGADVEDAVRLDHDTLGVAGSPAIVDTILAKIEACDVFIPDVTFVAQNNGRRCPNPNVMIEYGYALRAAGPDKIVAVMNTHFGPATDIPFDMRHRRFPITYELAPDADPDTRRRVREQLTADVADAIAAILDQREPEPVASPPAFVRSSSFDGGATFVEANEIFPMWLDGEGDVQRRFPVGPKMLLRLMPRDAAPVIERAALLEAVAGSELWPLGYQRYQGWGMATSRYGACYLARHPADDSLIGAISQVMLNREIWGVETYHLTHAASRRWVDRDYPVIPDTLMRQIFEDALTRYLTFARVRLGLQAPFILIAGVTNLEGHRITLSQNQISNQIYDPAILRETLVEDPEQSAGVLLHPFFAALYDAVGIRLPPPGAL